MPEAKLKIYAAMLAIQKDVEAIGRDSMNRDQGYAFRSADAITAHLQPLFKKHGVFCVPTVLAGERDQYQSARGSTMHNQRTTVQYRFYAEDGSHVDAIVVGEGTDSSDKATSKSMTMAQKVALAQVFTIPWSDVTADADEETPEAPPRSWPEGDALPAARGRSSAQVAPPDTPRTDLVTQADLAALTALAKEAALVVKEHPFRTLDTGLKALGLPGSPKGTRSWKMMELHLLQTLAGPADLAGLTSVIKNRAEIS